ncbi:bifunctional 3-(3-hydroxy-phenyl)propionate/3-hydroxycinnamic acid hydroxylase [Streptomyces sp. MB09-02B]|uniref:bifunctional 3-(3-hydroxy-phenyl)propionate/3-hydroxycinnamic acid hydroxylase n=1 Tax=Streptomyces sp. MB09-02B TaxID=3028667 RepID=UPI0029B62B93|nr:bifunctional 3-(3-hydroxy-phenyl)propionate/3-hydroxycinnamic acid hydroxylase [Streptomyces sp. MB09-02B]MDX3642856.1 bifunctional 3-(3-hydroxy-phenyl)propionate/3-hydroxycinnamic acid hydroxylase [Streptomyces sp. MB09-02B]
MSYDAIVIGYGPAGATMANLLGQRDWRVAVVERSRTVYADPRAITADHEAMRVFQHIGLAEEITRGTVPHPGTDFVGADGLPIKHYEPAPPPYLLGWEPNFMFCQPELEAVLRRGVDRFPNVEVMLGRSCRAVWQDEDGVRVQVDDDVLSAKYLVACDGASSGVRRDLAASLDDLAFDEWWVVVDTHVSGDAELPERVTQYCRPERPGTYIVGPGALRRWEIKLLPGEDPEEFRAPEKVRSVLGRFVDVGQVDIQRVAVYRFHALVVDRWRHGRIFLMGDAAHQMPPFLGQGMCAGIRDTVNLAWKLDGVERQGFDASLLDTYGQERKPHVRAVVETTKSLGVIIGETDPVEAARRDDTLRNLPRMTSVRQKSIPGLDSGLIALDEGGPGVAAGELFPQPRTSQGALLDDVIGAGFWLVVHRDDVLDQELRGTWAEVSGHIVHVTEEMDPDRLVRGWSEQFDAAAVIVRPDRYVFGAARDRDHLRGLVVDLVRRLRGGTAVRS